MKYLLILIASVMFNKEQNCEFGNEHVKITVNALISRLVINTSVKKISIIFDDRFNSYQKKIKGKTILDNRKIKFKENGRTGTWILFKSVSSQTNKKLEVSFTIGENELEFSAGYIIFFCKNGSPVFDSIDCYFEND